MYGSRSAIRRYDELPEQFRTDLPVMSRHLVQRDFGALAAMAPITSDNVERFEEELDGYAEAHRRDFDGKADLVPISGEVLRRFGDRHDVFYEYEGGTIDWLLHAPVFWDAVNEIWGDLEFILEVRRNAEGYSYTKISVYVP